MIQNIEIFYLIITNETNIKNICEQSDDKNNILDSIDEYLFLRDNYLISH
jgi:hypothetical protein